ncbi:Metallo-dependent phosphatase [Leucogyrophana mollusca]|uniref:Metallo-dependent phosphatase n=1 Tax=Leucogyrophana mollusca TaxID=85980 RepID=A0ACB8B2K0_9AGAM|nr:Metallo-dependent phosphatase [Leucogyrophana mollusca]
MTELESARVYTDFHHKLPPHPGSEWTRFVCISDTHSRVFPVPPGDVLLHAGDLSSWGSLDELRPTVEWLKSLEHPVKIMIAGNHDLCLDEQWGLQTYGINPDDIRHARAYVRSDAGLHYLEYEAFQFTAPSGRTWKVYGSPAAPIHVQGAFQYGTSEEARAIYDRIPLDTEILVTHTPPFMTQDRTRKGKNAGCQILASALQQLPECRLHVFGHIHEANGAQTDTDASGGTGRVFVNAAVASHGNAIVVDLKN